MLNSNFGGISFGKNSKGEYGYKVGASTEIIPFSCIKLLWTNPSPLSAFSGQTINLDLTNYDAILITSVYITSYPTNYNDFIQYIPKGYSTTLHNNFYGSNTAFSRTISINNNGVTVGNVTGSGGNGATVPYKIYGVSNKVSIDYYK